MKLAMCHIFSGQNPENYRCVTKSIRLDGQVTSVRLERLYWSILDELAASEDVSTPAFISKLHREVLAIRGAPNNFSSILRCACLISKDIALSTRLEEEEIPQKKAG